MVCEFKHPGKNGHCVNLIEGSPGDPCLCKRGNQFLCVEDLKKNLPKMSHSSRMAFSHCRQRYYFQKIQGIEPKPEALPEAVKCGAIWDQFTQSQYEGRPFRDHFHWMTEHYNLSDQSYSKLYGLIKGFREIGFRIDTDDLTECQHPFDYTDGEVVVTGYIDRAYSDHLVETKCGSRPEFHHSLHAIASQMSTYLLSDSTYEFVIIEAVRLPQLKTGWGRFSDEDAGSYTGRIYSDIISRPSFYFPGYDKGSKTYGKKFYRSEFPLEQIREDYRKITRDMKRAIEEDSFYQNFLACYVPTPCVYLPICQTGVVSNEIYQIKQKGGEITNDSNQEN